MNLRMLVSKFLANYIAGSTVGLFLAETLPAIQRAKADEVIGMSNPFDKGQKVQCQLLQFVSMKLVNCHLDLLRTCVLTKNVKDCLGQRHLQTVH